MEREDAGWLGEPGLLASVTGRLSVASNENANHSYYIDRVPRWEAGVAPVDFEPPRSTKSRRPRIAWVASDDRELQMAFVITVLTMLRRWGQLLGPYVMLEILLPGGTLLALLLFLYRRKCALAMSPAAPREFERTADGVAR